MYSLSDRGILLLYSGRKSIQMLVSILISFIVAASGMGGVVPSTHDPGLSYTYNGITISMTGTNTLITMEGQSYNVNWDVTVLGSSGPQFMAFSNVSYSRINNTMQNSVVMLENNSLLKVAEVFSFSGNGVDASIAIKNLQGSDATIEAMFTMTTSLVSSVQLNGFFSSTKSSLSSVYPVVINSRYLSMDLGQVNVNWQNEGGIFGAGVVAKTGTNTVTALPFGPILLLPDETYSIDPVISPVEGNQVAASEPAVRIPCPGCGGGGGGGSSGTPPGSTTIVSVVNNEMLVQPSISVVAHADSVGSGSVSLNLQGYDFGTSTWQSLASVWVGSSTGDCSLTWNGNAGTEYFFTQVRVDAGNGYGSGSWSYENINYTAVSENTITDTSGNTLGYIFNSVGIDMPVDTTRSPDNTALNTIFAPTSSSYTVNSVSQVVKYMGGNNPSVGDPHFELDPSQNPNPVAGYFQNYENGNGGANANAIDALAVALSAAGLIPGLEALGGLGALIGALALLPAPSYSLTTKNLNDYFSYNVSAGMTAPEPTLCGRVGGYYCDYTYNDLYVTHWYTVLGVPIYPIYTPSYIFSVYASFYYNVNSPLPGSEFAPGFIGTLHYTSTYTIAEAGTTNAFSASDTLFYTMAGGS